MKKIGHFNRIIILCSILCIALAYKFLYEPLIFQTSSLSKSIAEVQAQLDSTKTGSLPVSDNALSEIEALSDRTHLFYPKLYDDVILRDLSSYFNKIHNISNISWTHVTEPILINNQSIEALAQDINHSLDASATFDSITSGLEMAILNIQYDCPFEYLSNLLSNLEELPVLISIPRLSMSYSPYTYKGYFVLKFYALPQLIDTGD